MNIAVATEWGENFCKYAFFKVENGKTREQEIIPVPEGGVEKLTGQLVGLQVDILIAPAIPEAVEKAIVDAGVSVISGITGKAGNVAAAYLDGSLEF